MILLELHMKLINFLKIQINIIEWHRKKGRGREQETAHKQRPLDWGLGCLSPQEMSRPGSELRQAGQLPAWLG